MDIRLFLMNIVIKSMWLVVVASKAVKSILKVVSKL